MKKQFSIKTINVVKGNIVTVAKTESNNILKFLKPADCCPTMDFTAVTKPAFSL